MKKRNPLEYILPSISDVLFLCFFFWILGRGSTLLADGDTSWHLVTGENILKTFKIPFADPYSHTMPGTPWTAHEWLSEVIFASLHRLMGLNGVVLVTAVVITITFFFLYRFLVRRNVSPLIAAFMTAFAATVSVLHWLARPHIFSLPLTLAFVVILELYQREKVNHLKLLPLLMALWVNLHAGYILGLMLVFIYAGGNLLLALVKRDGRDAHMDMFKAIGLTAIVTVLATFVNPHGPAILLFPFHLVGRKYIMDNVMEWLSPNFHTDVYFEAMLLLFIVIFVLSKRKPDIFEGASALLLTHMSLYSVRYVPLLCIIITPMAASRADEVLDTLAGGLGEIRIVKRVAERFRKMSENVKGMEARLNSHLWVYVTVAAFTLIGLNGGRAGHAQVMDYAHDKDRFPVAALQFAVDNGIEGNMFNNDGWGGYIIYKSYPRYKVFFDGRSDMYGVPFMKEYAKVARAQAGYEEVLDKYKVTWVLFDAGSPICRLLAAGGKWKLVYADSTADILLRDIPRYRSIIDKYRYTRFLPPPPEEDAVKK
jgi:hypothetical protein